LALNSKQHIEIQILLTNSIPWFSLNINTYDTVLKPIQF